MPKIGLTGGSGKNVKRVITTGRGGAFKRARKPDAVNLSNTYGIKGKSGHQDGSKGAVTQNKPANKFSVAKAKGKLRG